MNILKNMERFDIAVVTTFWDVFSKFLKYDNYMKIRLFTLKTVKSYDYPLNIASSTGSAVLIIELIYLWIW